MAIANSTPQIHEHADVAAGNSRSSIAQVLQISDYRRAARSGAQTGLPSDTSTPEVLAKLTRCDHFIYAGVTPDDMVHFGTVGFGNVNSNLFRYGAGVSDIDRDSAEYLRDAALRLLGRLQEIIDAGDGRQFYD